jgi:hypothetical protein
MLLWMVGWRVRFGATNAEDATWNQKLRGVSSS